MENDLNATVGEIVTKDFRTASVFSKYGNEVIQNLHKHIHLENNILFPKSIELEQIVCS